MNVFDHIEALEQADSEECCRQETYTYPPCPQKVLVGPKKKQQACPGKIRTIKQMPTAEREGMCFDCITAHESGSVLPRNL